MPVHEFGFAGKTLNAKVLNVYDACTFKAQFKLSSKIQLSCKCRLQDLDCPRNRPNRKNPYFLQEKAAARKARAYFMSLLRQLSEDDEEGYFPMQCHGHIGGQILVSIPWDDTGSVADIMLGEGHVRPLTTGRRPPWSFPDTDPTVRVGLDCDEEDEKAETLDDHVDKKSDKKQKAKTSQQAEKRETRRSVERKSGEVEYPEKNARSKKGKKPSRKGRA